MEWVLPTPSRSRSSAVQHVLSRHCLQASHAILPLAELMSPNGFTQMCLLGISFGCLWLTMLHWTAFWATGGCMVVSVYGGVGVRLR
jgi:hypothetical protein